MAPDELRELYEYRLTKAVASNVEEAIRRKFVWVNVAAGLAFLGVSWLGGSALLTAEVKGRVDTRVEAEVQARREEIGKLLGEVQAKAIEAKARLAQIDERMDAVSVSERAIKEQFDIIRRQAKEIIDAKNTIDKNTSDIVLLKQGLTDLGALSGQVAEIGSLIQDLAGSRADLSAKATGLQAAADGIGARLSSTSQSLARPIVFVQFSGRVSRARIKQVSSALEASIGVRVPGEQRVAANVRQVRYYHADDLDLAQRTADAAASILEQQGFGAVQIEVKSFVNWGGDKPAPGTIELWLSALPEPSS